VTSTTPSHPEEPDPLKPAGEDDDGDRISITDVNGTVARFEMSYSPPSASAERVKFGPPLLTRVPSALYLACALVLGAVVLYAYSWAPSSSRVFAWVVEGDRFRPISANILAVVVVVSAVATVIRTHMRGVLVSDDWVEARTLLPLGIPRARRWVWPQVLRVIIDGTHVALELWDGSFERLPEVARGPELVLMVSEMAQRRRIDVTVLQHLDRRDLATRQ
jgi:hypothetical protein